MKVLITGASSGIGKEFAKTFAKKGHDLAIVARNKEELEKLAKDLQKDNKSRNNCNRPINSGKLQRNSQKSTKCGYLN